MAAFLAFAVACGAGERTPGPAAREPATAAAGLGRAAVVRNPGVREPSGVAYHAKLERLFVVGDEGTLAELDLQGRLLRSSAVGGNLEDVAVHTPSGHLLLLDEVKGTLTAFDPVARRMVARWRLDERDLIGRKERSPDGFEGLAFREEDGSPGGGVFYLLHQRGPAMLVAVALDPTDGGGKIGESSVRGRWKLSGRGDLTAVTWVESLGRLLVVADATDRMLLVDREGRVRGEVSLPGVQQEGICPDGAGGLWIADDRAAQLVHYPGALKVLASSLGIQPTNH